MYVPGKPHRSIGHLTQVWKHTLILSNCGDGPSTGLHTGKLNNKSEASKGKCCRTANITNLRVFSPAALKPKQSNTTPEVFHKKNIQLTRIEPLGKYGHRLVFDDKHSAIYSEEIFINLYENHEINWQKYCDNLTSSQNRESSINFVEVK